jgi:type III secretion protein W
MGVHTPSPMSGVTPSNADMVSASIKQAAATTATQIAATQIESKEALADDDEKISTPALAKKAEKLETKGERIKKALKAGVKGAIEAVAKAEEETTKHAEQNLPNPELKKETLQRLRNQIKPNTSVEEILKLVMGAFDDITLSDEALDFLINDTADEGDKFSNLHEAKSELIKKFGREITAGRNIQYQARAASKQGLGSPTNLRQFYRTCTEDVGVDTVRDQDQLFQEIKKNYKSFEDQAKAVGFLLHSLGADLKNPSIAPGKLHQLLKQTRRLQTFLWNNLTFKDLMRLAIKMLTKLEVKLK